MDFKKFCYTFLARVCCLLCHGHCCYPTMDFKYEDGVVIYMGRLDEKCAAYSLLTGMCTKYKERKLPICLEYKCRMLNLISELCGQPIWEGKFRFGAS